MMDRRPELRPLTSFRFFAALAVFLRHSHAWLNGHVDMPAFVSNCLHDGFCGVTFFYVLSGFILTYNYQSIFTRLTGRSVWSFCAARLARIYPVHLLAFLVAVPLVLGDILAEPSRAVVPTLANLTLTQSFVPDQAVFFSFNTVSWSLSDEMFFYLLLPLVLWTMHGLDLVRSGRAVALAATCWLLALACVLLGHDHPQGLWLWYVNPAFRLLDFLVGVSLGQIFLRLQRQGVAGPSRPVATLLEAGTLGLLALALVTSPLVPLLLRRSSYYTPCFALLILVFAFQRGRLSRVLSGPGLRLLGEVSFSFYMFHYTIMRLIDHYPRVTWLGEWPPLPRTLAVFLLSAAASVACYFWYELPLRDRVRRWLDRSRSRPPEEAYSPRPARRAA
jgi:peptidoglycan/LPS O-acetylase OafA/YrhL